MEKKSKKISKIFLPWKKGRMEKKAKYTHGKKGESKKGRIFDIEKRANAGKNLPNIKSLLKNTSKNHIYFAFVTKFEVP